MIKDILKYGLGASITSLFCCVAPAVLFSLGIGSGIFAFQFADFYYNEDGTANLSGWILRGLGVLIVAYGIYKYNQKESCSLNTPKQKIMNKILFGGLTVSLALGLYFGLTSWTTSYFEVIDKARQQEYKLQKTLTDEQIYIMVNGGTEARFSSPLNSEKRSGYYTSPATGDTLFLSSAKFDSKTGWPSFDDATSRVALGNYEQGGREVIEKSTGYHLGHLFTGEGFTSKNKRFCINGGALIFKLQK